MALANIIRTWIDGVESVEATDVTFSSPQPGGQKFGAQGLIGTFLGQAGSRANFTFAQTATKSQFEVMVKTNQTPKAIVFQLGQDRYLIPDAYYMDAEARGAYESGDITKTCSIMGGKMVKIS